MAVVTRLIAATGLALLVTAAGTQSVSAQTVYVQPNPYVQQFADQLRENQQNWQNLGVQVGNQLAPSLLRLQATLTCGKWTRVTAYYSNGAVQNKDIPADDANQLKLASLLQQNSAVVRVTDQGCDE